MTSNLGSEQLLNLIEKGALSKEQVLQAVDPIIKKYFRPEFLNRLDDILPFLPLQEKDMGKIVLIQLEKVANRLKERDSILSWAESVITHLAKEGYNPSFGARPLKRLIQQTVTNLLSSAILQGKIKNADHVELTLEKGKISFQKEGEIS